MTRDPNPSPTRRRPATARPAGVVAPVDGSMTGKRRLIPVGRHHICSHCGHVDDWGPSWSWYGSEDDIEAGRRVIKACCDECRQRLEHHP